MNFTRFTLQLIFLVFCFFTITCVTVESRSAAFAQKVSQTDASIYDLRLYGKIYPIKYQIMGAGNKLTNISGEADNATLLVAIGSKSNGRLSIDLPRNIIDSKRQGNADDRYIVFQDGQVTTTEEIRTDHQTRTLAIDFDRGTSQIEIVGTRIIPELGPTSTLWLAVALIGLICAHVKYRRARVRLNC